MRVYSVTAMLTRSQDWFYSVDGIVTRHYDTLVRIHTAGIGLSWQKRALLRQCGPKAKNETTHLPNR
jgi:hypothetical protein